MYDSQIHGENECMLTEEIHTKEDSFSNDSSLFGDLMGCLSEDLRNEEGINKILETSFEVMFNSFDFDEERGLIEKKNFSFSKTFFFFFID